MKRIISALTGLVASVFMVSYTVALAAEPTQADFDICNRMAQSKMSNPSASPQSGPQNDAKTQPSATAPQAALNPQIAGEARVENQGNQLPGRADGSKDNAGATPTTGSGTTAKRASPVSPSAAPATKTPATPSPAPTARADTGTQPGTPVSPSAAPAMETPATPSPAASAAAPQAAPSRQTAGETRVENQASQLRGIASASKDDPTYQQAYRDCMNKRGY
jgi:hypothetical protein